jgi:hypothetical protein
MGFNPGGGGGPSAINTSTDAAVSNLQDNQVLTWDNGVGKWKNASGVAAGVSSVNTRTGDVTLAKSDVGLDNVDNTSDVNKPVSTAQSDALALKAPLDSPTLTGVPTAPTPTAGDNDTSLATTGFVQQALGSLEIEDLADVASLPDGSLLVMNDGDVVGVVPEDVDSEDIVYSGSTSVKAAIDSLFVHIRTCQLSVNRYSIRLTIQRRRQKLTGRYASPRRPQQCVYSSANPRKRHCPCHLRSGFALSRSNSHNLPCPPTTI